MENFKSFLDIILILVSIGLIISLIGMTSSLYRYYRLKQQSLSNDIEYKVLKNERELKTVDYSNNVMELLRSIIGQIAVIKFRTFQDNREMDKITKENLKQLVKEVGEMANQSINMNNIFIEDTFYDRAFIDSYVAETSAIMVKELFEKSRRNEF